MPLIIFASAAAFRVGQPVALVGTPIPFRQMQSMRDCRLTIPKLGALCRAGRQGSQFEIALADFDSDGLQDVALRIASMENCGSHGCHTEIYQALPRGGFSKRIDHLITYGPISRCRQGATMGVAFPVRGPGFACFPFPGAAAARR